MVCIPFKGDAFVFLFSCLITSTFSKAPAMEREKVNIIVVSLFDI